MNERDLATLMNIAREVGVICGVTYDGLPEGVSGYIAEVAGKAFPMLKILRDAKTARGGERLDDNGMSRLVADAEVGAGFCRLFYRKPVRKVVVEWPVDVELPSTKAVISRYRVAVTDDNGNSVTKTHADLAAAIDV